MIFKPAYVLDVNDTYGNIRNALDDFVIDREAGQNKYYHLDMYDLLELEEEASPELKVGWQELQDELRKANIFSFYLHFWW